MFGNITAHGQVYLLPKKPPSNLVWIDPKGHTNYWCSVQGDTSGTSSSPRTEGRQTYPNSSENYNWTVGDGSHSMSGTVRVELAPSSGKVIVAQIHGYKAPNPFVMVTWWNGYARVDLRTSPLGNAIKVLSTPCALGQAFKYSLEINESGVLNVNLNGLKYSLTVDSEWEKYPFFFKNGSYVIDNVGEHTEGGWVVYQEFNVYAGVVE